MRGAKDLNLKKRNDISTTEITIIHKSNKIFNAYLRWKN